MDLNTKRGWKCSSGRRGDRPGDYSAQRCISPSVGCSCGLLVARASPPFWADHVWIDWVSWCAAGSSKAAQALIVAIRHGESRQKRGAAIANAYFKGQSCFRGLPEHPVFTHHLPHPNQLFLLKHTQDWMMFRVCQVECYSVWQIFVVKYLLCARSLV